MYDTSTMYQTPDPVETSHTMRAVVALLIFISVSQDHVVHSQSKQVGALAWISVKYCLKTLSYVAITTNKYIILLTL